MARGLGRGASTCHLLEMSSILDPSVRPVQEIKAKELKSEDEAGDPPARNGAEVSEAQPPNEESP